MTKHPKLLLIDESAIYGGHEGMLMAFLNAILPQLLEFVSVDFLVNSNNKKLIAQLAMPEFNEVNVHFISLSGVPIKPITQFFLRGDAKKIRASLEELQPSVVLNIQGTIEIGCTSLRVCKKLGIRVLSYLPITKSSAQLGVFLGALRDFVCKVFYYPAAHKIITISKANAFELQSLFAVPPARIAIVHNFVDKTIANDPQENPVFAVHKKHLALVGRISNEQKQQKGFLAAWLKTDFASDYVIHVVGDGSDVESCQLRELCADGVKRGDVVFHGWQSPSYVTQVITQSDLLLLPSRFEGVPLVMIEAIQLGCLVVASAVDGMKEFLPSELLFDVGDWHAMFNIINQLESSGLRANLLAQSQSQFEVFNKKQNTNNFLEYLRNELVTA